MAQSSPSTKEGVTGAPVRHFSIFLDNKVGALLEVVKLLEQKGVIVLAFSIVDSAESSIARMIVSDPTLVDMAAQKLSAPLMVLNNGITPMTTPA